eukprot:393119_1
MYNAPSLAQPLPEDDDIAQPYGDDKVHFDPVRAVQSIKLTNNYRTAQSNDNFLSTVILNTYFFNNTVLHHSDINQPPPKLPYDTTEHHSSSESSCTSSDDDDASCSCCASTSDDEGTDSSRTRSDPSDEAQSVPPSHKQPKHNQTLSQNIDQLEHSSSTPSHQKS